jgi:hypothetical protein
MKEVCKAVIKPTEALMKFKPKLIVVPQFFSFESNLDKLYYLPFIVKKLPLVSSPYTYMSMKFLANSYTRVSVPFLGSCFYNNHFFALSIVVLVPVKFLKPN